MRGRANLKRRWIGGGLLGGAILMLILGESILKERLEGLAFLAYWAGCFVLTGGAMVVAFIDAREVARGTVRDQRDLLQSTLKEIEDEARGKKKKKLWNN